MSLRIGVDVDGCLADFTPSFVPLLNKAAMGRIILPVTYQPQTWDWPEAAGFNAEEINAAWKMAKQDEDFWLNLEELPDARPFAEWAENELGVNDDVYFITNRPGVGAKLSTESWLLDVGFSNPTVLISEWKAKVCDALHITHYIDDKTGNCLAVRDTGCSQVFMREQAWNQPIAGVTRVRGMLEFARLVEGK